MSATKAKTESEVQLCDRLRDWAEGLGFEVYPEVVGWDLVLVASEPIEIERYGTKVFPGEQVGIHAKLRASCEVLMQACPYNEDSPGPRHPYVAVPQAGEGFRFVAQRLGIGVIETDVHGRSVGRKIPERQNVIKVSHDPRQRPAEVPQLKLPPVASRCIVAGAPSPRVLSEWRVKALHWLADVRAAGTFTVTHLARFGLGKSWVERWGEPVDWCIEMRRGKPVRVRVYRLTDNPEALPDWGYRDVAAEMLAMEPAREPIEPASTVEQLALGGSR